MSLIRISVSFVSLIGVFAFVAPPADAGASGVQCQQKLEKSGFSVVRFSRETERKGIPAYEFEAVGQGKHPVWGDGEFSWQVFTDRACNILEKVPNV